MTRRVSIYAAVLLAAVPMLATAQQVPIAPATPQGLPGMVYVQGTKEENRAALQEYLPGALDGWTREIVVEVDAAQAPMLGDGYIVEAEYRGPNGDVTLSMVVDAPMVDQMAPMFGNVAMMGMLGEVIEIGGREFVITESNEIVGLVDGRIMLAASSSQSNRASAISYIEQIDFEGLESFNR